MRKLLVESCEFVEVRSKKTECVDLGSNMSVGHLGLWNEKVLILTQRLPRQAQIRHRWRFLQAHVSRKSSYY